MELVWQKLRGYYATTRCKRARSGLDACWPGGGVYRHFDQVSWTHPTILASTTWGHSRCSVTAPLGHSGRLLAILPCKCKGPPKKELRLEPQKEPKAERKEPKQAQGLVVQCGQRLSTILGVHYYSVEGHKCSQKPERFQFSIFPWKVCAV